MSVELREKNGVMSEVVRIAEFGVYGHDTVVSMKITEKGYREGYGVWEEDNSSYYYFNVLGDEESFDFATAEFERIMSRWVSLIGFGLTKIPLKSSIGMSWNLPSMRMRNLSWLKTNLISF